MGAERKKSLSHLRSELSIQSSDDVIKGNYAAKQPRAPADLGISPPAANFCHLLDAPGITISVWWGWSQEKEDVELDDKIASVGVLNDI